MKNRFKHKAAWWLRKIADYLEPRSVNLAQKAKYRPEVLAVVIDREDFEDQDFHDLRVIKALNLMGDAARKFVVVEENQPGPGGNNRTRLELKILVPNE